MEKRWQKWEGTSLLLGYVKWVLVYRGVKSIARFCDGRKSSKMKRENVTCEYPYDCSV